MNELRCGDCGAPMRLIRESRYGPFYGCTRYPECRGTHGVHADGRPLGVPGDQRTRELRKDVHGAFDRFWKAGSAKGKARRRRRQSAYRWLARILGMPAERCHIAEFDAATCERALAVLEGDDLDDAEPEEPPPPLTPMTPELARRFEGIGR